MPLTDRAQSVRMPGSSIAAPSALAWVTDFLNAAYYARPKDQRTLDDLRLATCVLTTRWHRLGADRRLGARDLPAFNRAFGTARLKAAPRLTLDRDALVEGGAAMLGDWFPDAVQDAGRRAHGIAFETVADRELFDPSVRLRHAAIGDLTPPMREPGEQEWSNYPPVPIASAERVIDLLGRPERWPDFAAEGGRFTALRPGGLDGQTFEIEILAIPAPRAPLFSRGYVTATRVLAEDDPRLPVVLEDLGRCSGAPAVPDGARTRVLVELVTHAGHFLGRGKSRIIVFEHEGAAFIRDIGSWDPLPPELAAPYALAGRAAQHAFWGPDEPDRSMLVQVARLAG